MDEQSDTDLDQTAAVSDEALEAAANAQRDVLFRTLATYSCCPGCD